MLMQAYTPATQIKYVDCDEDVLLEDIPTHKEFCDVEARGISAGNTVLYVPRVLSVYMAITILLAQ